MRIITIDDNSVVIDYLVAAITKRLVANEKVLWLIPGGSAVPIAVEVSHAISSELKKNLTVSLTDERYGALNHADSNWFQLSKAGFDFSGVTQKPVLILPPVYPVMDMRMYIVPCPCPVVRMDFLPPPFPGGRVFNQIPVTKYSFNSFIPDNNVIYQVPVPYRIAGGLGNNRKTFIT